MRAFAARTLSLIAVLGMFVSVSAEVRAQEHGAPSQVAESRDIRARPQEVTISIRVDRLLGRVDVTTTIPVDDPPAVPRSRYDLPTARMIDGGLQCERKQAPSSAPTAINLALPID